MEGAFESSHSRTSTSWLYNALDIANSLTARRYVLTVTDYLSNLSSYLNNVNWSASGVTPPGNEELETPNRGEGNIDRTIAKRVRCVYYPHNNTKATREKASGISSLYNKNGYEYNLSK